MWINLLMKWIFVDILIYFTLLYLYALLKTSILLSYISIPIRKHYGQEVIVWRKNNPVMRKSNSSNEAQKNENRILKMLNILLV